MHLHTVCVRAVLTLCVFSHVTIITTFAFSRDCTHFCWFMYICLGVHVAHLPLKAPGPIVRRASVALIWDYIAITLLLYTNAAPLHLCVRVHVCMCM